MKFCGECGKRNKTEALFCFDCGSKFAPGSNVQLQAPKTPPISTEKPIPRPAAKTQKSLTPNSPVIERPGVAATPSKVGQLNSKAESKSTPAKPVTQKPATAPKPPKPPKPPKKPRKPLSVRAKATILGLALIPVVGTVAALIPWPTPVSISVALDAPYGGVFDSNCQISPEALEAGSHVFVLVEPGVPADQGQQHELSFSKTDGGACLGLADVYLYADDTFEIYMFNEPIGKVNEYEISEGYSPETASLPIYRSLTGTVRLTDEFSNCVSVEAGIDCSVPQGATIAADLNKSIMSCSGAGEMSYFKSGASIEVKGKLGSGISALVEIGPGKAVMSASDIQAGKVTCEFKFQIPTIPNDESGYTFQLGQTEFSAGYQELLSSNWSVEYDVSQ